MGWLWGGGGWRSSVANGDAVRIEGMMAVTSVSSGFLLHQISGRFNAEVITVGFLEVPDEFGRLTMSLRHHEIEIIAGLLGLIGGCARVLLRGRGLVFPGRLSVCILRISQGSLVPALS